ncbi:MAG TPA: hypothetical protein VM662_12295 [Sphingomonas sp.]|nr:hypothetical protein [Sphingomonas sp.]
MIRIADRPRAHLLLQQIGVVAGTSARDMGSSPSADCEQVCTCLLIRRSPTARFS